MEYDFDGVDFDKLEKQNSRKVEEQETFEDEGDCEGCKI